MNTVRKALVATPLWTWPSRCVDLDGLVGMREQRRVGVVKFRMVKACFVCWPGAYRPVVN